MKANRIPRKERLEARILKLSYREDGAWVKFGGGNPYYKCKYCGVSNVEESINGHNHNCLIKGIKKEIAHYTQLMEQDDGQTRPETTAST